jgi:hypothetical protein
MPYSWYVKNHEKYNITMQIIVRSLERNKKHRIAKWICMYLYVKYQILIDVPSLLGWGQLKSKVTDEIYEKVIEAEEYFERMEDVVTIVDGVTNPTGIYHYAEKIALQNGDYYVKQNVEGQEEILKKKDFKMYTRPTQEELHLHGNFKGMSNYVEKNKRHLVVHVTDHIQAMGKELKLTDKENLDKHSMYSRELRDVFNFNVVNVSQLNRGISETSRRIHTDLYPEDKDFSGSSNMYNDSDMAAILFNPNKYNLEAFEGYDIKKIISEAGINRFRSMHILKNTYGPDNLIFAYQFVGENGIFNELPNPKSLEIKDYHSIANLPYKLKLTNQ